MIASVMKSLLKSWKVYRIGLPLASLTPIAVRAWSRYLRSAVWATGRFSSWQCHWNSSGMGGL